MELKKYNIVEFSTKDNGKLITIRGIVKQAGLNSISVDYSLNGGYFNIKVPPSKFYQLKFISERPIMPSGLETLELKAYKEFETSRGVAFNVKVYFKGRWVGMLENDGNGGGNCFRTTTTLPINELNNLAIAAVDKHKLFVDGSKLETFLSFALNGAYDCGQTIEEYAAI